MNRRNAGSDRDKSISPLFLPRAVSIEIRRHAERERPLEACGLLAGKGDRIARAFPMTNVEASERHFFLEPEEQFAVVREARAAGLEIIAAYHSHPEGPPAPSAEDIRLAIDPDLIHVIVSLEPAEPGLRAFRIREGEVREVPLMIC